MIEGINDYIDAVTNSKRDQWIIEHLGSDYPLNLANVSVLNDFVNWQIHNHSLTIYQCENCGRIWIQKVAEPNHFRSFYPDEDWKGTLQIRQE